ncbi:transporter substrate-binding domain-containing protein [Antarcticibacterium sp. 1MA-6-2]|uniref:ion channel n=1 Tax=Antarcticibacterium sp. 1MA-6-2 TaxID=2908210 RepID=UPI001F1DFC10|nr:transporter substrate-binding domain-containing protein [Antarcticibacterium sp. 1MA-6-2]UJH90069.1 transporter substrate-binding domain-containing protein [Antarcticibacterium sp. 1MA-6-2]
MRAVVSILPFFIISFLNPINAQDTAAVTPEQIVIGITPTPPFVMENERGFTRLSISSWELVNESLDLNYTYRSYSSLLELLTAIENKEVDLSINPITVTDRRMKRISFSQPYFISYTGIAQQQGTIFWKYLGNILSWNFLSAILILLAVIFIFGFLVWIFERRKNKEEFGGGLKGVFQGFWWSAVTMTTVGYGDKSPRTFGGRVIGLIWMFMAIILISTLTAGIASSLTVQNINNEINSIRDLENFEVVTVSGSSSQELLSQYNILFDEVINEHEGIDAILEKEGVLFVYDQPILKYEIDQRELHDELEVLQRTLKRDYYSYSFPKGSPLIEKINPALVASLKSMEWNVLIEEYK